MLASRGVLTPCSCTHRRAVLRREAVPDRANTEPLTAICLRLTSHHASSGIFAHLLSHCWTPLLFTLLIYPPSASRTLCVATSRCVPGTAASIRPPSLSLVLCRVQACVSALVYQQFPKRSSCRGLVTLCVWHRLWSGRIPGCSAWCVLDDTMDQHAGHAACVRTSGSLVACEALRTGMRMQTEHKTQGRHALWFETDVFLTLRPAPCRCMCLP